VESRSVLIVVTTAALLCAPAHAQFRGREKPREWDVTLGAAVASRPSFEGSDRSIVRPLPFVAVRWRDTISLGEGGISVTGHLKKFRFGGGLTIDAGRKDHASGGIFESGDDRLKGLGTIRASPGFRAFASTRLSLFNVEVSAVKSLNHGVTGTLGLSSALPLGKKLILMPHIRATWADDQYMQTYFGVTPAQANASIFSRFNAASGFKDVRAGANLIYRFNDHWFIGTDVGVTRLLGDAALSPISIRDTNVTVMGMAGYRF
jgi:outer membrane protein